MHDVDVVIVAFRSRDAIGDLVASVQRDLDPASLVVVDNGDDGSADVAAAAGAVVSRRADNPGFGAAQNEGVSRGHAPFVLLLNPDARPVRNGVARGVELMTASSDIGAVQGEIVNALTGAPERSHGVELGPVHLLGRALGARRLRNLSIARRVAARTSLRDHVERSVVEPTDVETLAATALLVRRAAFERVGGFDEHYFLYGEDLDLCRRLRGDGWRLVALPNEFARHISGASSADQWDRELVWWQGTMRFARQWWSPWRRVVADLAAVLRWAGLALQRPRGAVRAWRAVVSRG